MPIPEIIGKELLSTPLLSERTRRIWGLSYVLLQEYLRSVYALPTGAINRDEVQTRMKSYFFLEDVDFADFANALQNRRNSFDYLLEEDNRFRENDARLANPLLGVQMKRRTQAAEVFTDLVFSAKKTGEDLDSILRKFVRHWPIDMREAYLDALLRSVNSRDPADIERRSELVKDPRRNTLTLNVYRTNPDPNLAVWDILRQVKGLQQRVTFDERQRHLLFVSWLLGRPRIIEILQKNKHWDKEHGVHYHHVNLNSLINNSSTYAHLTVSGLAPEFKDLLFAGFYSVKMFEKNTRDFLARGKFPQIGYALVPYSTFFTQNSR